MLGQLIQNILPEVTGLIDNLHTSGEEKAEAKLKLQRLLMEKDAMIEETAREEMRLQKATITAELQQGDLFTKRARPTVVYTGLAVMAINYCLAPIIFIVLDRPLVQIEMPAEFWMAWSGVVSIWSIGRSAERRGAQNKAINVITGGK
tara:strand:- start:84 stop:527 length:444 start_codon:yes stop_codon:yes gene_type:complete